MKNRINKKVEINPQNLNKVVYSLRMKVKANSRIKSLVGMGIVNTNLITFQNPNHLLIVIILMENFQIFQITKNLIISNPIRLH